MSNSSSAPRPILPLRIICSAVSTGMVLKFIDFMLEGRNAAETTNTIGAGNPNAAARPFIDPELLQVAAINPSAEQAKKLEQLVDLDAPTRRAWNRAWTEVKAGR